MCSLPTSPSKLRDKGETPRWLTLYTKPNMERQVSSFLLSRGIETYLPIFTHYTLHRRRLEAVPFFPCYLFARIVPTSPEYLSIMWTPGLRSIVRFDGKPAWLPDEFIWDLRAHLAHLDRCGYFIEPTFRPGDRVRITRGPLKDLEAVFDRSLSKEGRVRILLNFLGRLTACEVPEAWLTKAG